jgi:hypothetical protein
MIADLNYAIHRWEDDTHYQGQRLDQRDLMSWPHYDIFCVPR